MVQRLRWSLPILLICAASAAAQEWKPDRWHRVTEESPFFTQDRAHLHSAGILQGDGRFALMMLGDPEDGALVSVNLAMSEPAPGLTSTLVMPAGNILVREVLRTQLVAELTPDGQSVTYSFAIAPGDIEEFMAAEVWRVQAGGTLTTISLTGSHDAIGAALAARQAGAEQRSSAAP